MQGRFGHGFGAVRVHLDSAAQVAAAGMSSRAFAVGRHLAFAPGQYQPGTEAGRRLIAHELAHTLQQGRGGGQGEAVHAGAEHAADAAAAAALAGRRVPPQPGHALGVQRDGPTLPDLSPWRLDFSALQSQPPRQPYTVTRVENTGEDERLLHISTGQRYRVWRHRWVSTEDAGGSSPFVRGTSGIDESELWMTVQWCRGASEGSVRLFADAPERVLRAVGTAVLSGGDIGDALLGVPLTPALRADFSVGTVGFRLNAQTTLNLRGEVSGVEGRAGVDFNTRAGRLGVTASAASEEVGDNPLGGGRVTLGVEFTPGERRTAPDCEQRRTRVLRHTRFECQEIIDLPERRREVTERVPQTDRRTRHLYFPYWSSSIDARRSAAEQAAIVTDLGAGFAVASVRGYASPEGSRAAGHRFEGNDALSGARAQVAMDWLRAQCGERGAACLPPELIGEAGSERHTLLAPVDAAAGTGRVDTDTDTDTETETDTEVEVEVEGPRQADYAAEAFAADPADAAQRTPEVTAALARARTPAARAAVVYPQLRRVEIVLTRTREVERQRTEVTPASTVQRDVRGGCPEPLREAAFPTGQGR